MNARPAVRGKSWALATMLVLCGIEAGSALADVVLPEPNVAVTFRGQGFALAALPDGKVLVGGSFIEINGTQRANLARLMPDGSVDSSFQVDANNSVSAIAVSGNFIYIAGNFSSIGGQTRNALARLSLATGAVDSWTMDANNSVFSLLVDGTNLYVGGVFSTLGGAAHSGLARVTTGNGQLDAGFNPAFTGGAVQALASGGGFVYAGGSFTTANGQPQHYLARVSQASGALDSTWNPNFNTLVYTVVLNGPSLYVGGPFNSIGGTAVTGIVKLSVATAALDPNFAPGLDATVYSAALSGSDLLVAGDFASAGSTSIGPVARLNPATGALIAATTPNWNGIVQAVAQSGSRLFTVGSYTVAGGFDANSFTLMDAATLAVDGTRTLRLATLGSIFAMIQLPDGSVLIGGGFEEVNGRKHANLALLNADGTLNPGWTIDANSGVRTMVVNGSDLYLGGTFSIVGNVPARGLARVNLVARTVDAQFSAHSTNGTVLALAINGGKLYAGGSFTTLNGTAMIRAGRLDLTSGAVDAAWAPAPDGTVLALQPVAGDMMVGGLFSNIGGQPRKALAKVFGATGLANIAFNSDLAAGTSTPSVTAMALSGGSLFIGGLFTSVRGTAGVTALAKVDSDFGLLVPGFSAPLNAAPFALMVAGGAVYVGGPFAAVKGATRRGVARLDPGSGALDTTFGETPPTTSTPFPAVTALLATTGRIWLGGQFTTFADAARISLAAFGPLVPQVITVYEFFAPSLNHFFRTANAEEAAALKANPALGFNPTGDDFHAYSRAAFPVDANAVYRFYGSIMPGPNSHFYTATFAEYLGLRALQFAQPNTLPRWNFEEVAFAVNLPVALNTCPFFAPIKVFRAYNNRAAQGDSNHRYTTILVEYSRLIALGWLGEGVVMCALQ